jgi:hypothetical protein
MPYKIASVVTSACLHYIGFLIVATEPMVSTNSNVLVMLRSEARYPTPGIWDPGGIRPINKESNIFISH